MTHSEKSPFTSILRGRMDLSFIFSFNFSNFSPIISSISSSSSSFCFFIKSEIANKVSPEINTEGFRVKVRNFAKMRIFKSTDVYARMGKAKSRHDMDTAGVIVDIDTAQVRHWLDTGYDRQCYPCSEFWLRSDRTVRSVTDRGPSVPLEVIMAVVEIISFQVHGLIILNRNPRIRRGLKWASRKLNLTKKRF